MDPDEDSENTPRTLAQTTQEPLLLAQIQSLRNHIQIIKHIQTMSVLSLIFCVASTTLLFFKQQIERPP